MAALFSPKGPKLRLYETDESDAEPACHFLLPVSGIRCCSMILDAEADKDIE